MLIWEELLQAKLKTKVLNIYWMYANFDMPESKLVSGMFNKAMLTRDTLMKVKLNKAKLKFAKLSYC